MSYIPKEEIFFPHLDVLDELLEALLVVSDVELLDHDGVWVRVAECQQVAGIVEIPEDE